MSNTAGSHRTSSAPAAEGRRESPESDGARCGRYRQNQAASDRPCEPARQGLAEVGQGPVAGDRGEPNGFGQGHQDHRHHGDDDAYENEPPTRKQWPPAPPCRSARRDPPGPPS